MKGVLKESGREVIKDTSDRKPQDNVAGPLIILPLVEFYLVPDVLVQLLIIPTLTQKCLASDDKLYVHST